MDSVGRRVHSQPDKHGKPAKAKPHREAWQEDWQQYEKQAALEHQRKTLQRNEFVAQLKFLGSRSPSPQLEELLKKGRALEDAGRLEDACVAYQAAQKQDLGNEELRQYIGKLVARINSKQAQSKVQQKVQQALEVVITEAEQGSLQLGAMQHEPLTAVPRKQTGPPAKVSSAAYHQDLKAQAIAAAKLKRQRQLEEQRLESRQVEIETKLAILDMHNKVVKGGNAQLDYKNQLQQHQKIRARQRRDMFLQEQGQQHHLLANPPAGPLGGLDAYQSGLMDQQSPVHASHNMPQSPQPQAQHGWVLPDHHASQPQAMHAAAAQPSAYIGMRAPFAQANFHAAGQVLQHAQHQLPTRPPPQSSHNKHPFELPPSFQQQVQGHMPPAQIPFALPHSVAPPQPINQAANPISVTVYANIPSSSPQPAPQYAVPTSAGQLIGPLHARPGPSPSVLMSSHVPPAPGQSPSAFIYGQRSRPATPQGKQRGSSAPFARPVVDRPVQRIDPRKVIEQQQKFIEKHAKKEKKVFH